MSYILDALRKADAQRERGAARGIHAQGAALGSGAAAPSAGASGPWVAVAVAVALCGGAAWYLLRDKPASAPPPAAVVTAPTPAPAVTTPPPVVATAPVAQSVQPPPAMPAIVGTQPAGRTIPPRDPTNTSQPPLRGAQPVPGMIPEVAPSVRAAQAREAAMIAAAQRGRSMPAAPQSAPVQPPAVAAAPMPAPGAAPAPAAPAAPGLVGGLPPDAPKLAITGGVYSTSPTQRMLIVNGQVFNEGSELAPGVTLEAIQPKTAVLKFRGANYTVGY